MILSENANKNVPISLRGCVGWSAPLLFAHNEDRFSHVEARMFYAYSTNHIFSLSKIIFHNKWNWIKNILKGFLPYLTCRPILRVKSLLQAFIDIKSQEDTFCLVALWLVTLEFWLFTCDLWFVVCDYLVTLDFGQVCPSLGHVQRRDLNTSVWVAAHKD